MANPSIQQHEPLRIPSNWGTQERRFVSQLEEILDDVYKRFGRLKESDLGTALRKTIATASDDASSAKSTVEQTAEKFEAKFDSIGANGTETQTGITSITKDGVKVNNSNIDCTTQISADGLRISDDDGNVVGGTYKDNGKVVSVANVIKNPSVDAFMADVASKAMDAYEVYGFGIKVNGKDCGVVGGTYSTSPRLFLVAQDGGGVGMLGGDGEEVSAGNGYVIISAKENILFSAGEQSCSLTDLMAGGSSSGVKIAFGHASVNDSEATVLDYSSAGFTREPSVCVNYSSSTRWSGDAGALKVYYKTTTSANVIVGGSFPTSREIDWIAIGY